MAVYRRQKAKYNFEARTDIELSLQKGDIIRVWQTKEGEWPDMTNWITGENETTKMKGEFPGNYTEFVEEVKPDLPPPLPAKPDQNGGIPPPVPARHSSEPPPAQLQPISYPRQPPPRSPRGLPQPEPFPRSQAPYSAESTRRRNHDFAEQNCNRPVRCTVCK